MPRNGSGVYSKPAGTTAVPNTTIESAKFNQVVDDIAQDLNYPRPISAGGTGGETVSQALTNLGFSSFVKTLIDDVNGTDFFTSMGASRVLETSGRETLPDGFQVKWGVASLATADQRVNFPLAFPNSCTAVAMACGTYYPEQNRLIAAATSNVTPSGFDIRSRNIVAGAVSGQSGVIYHWIAVGY
ncbi:hypothetical protein JNB84_03240 [Rhizobium pusense]|uniref:gp53-like domain-containing protein n=1 Tax=Agrobacterium pusense TaxID=648995 RepID=UPI001C6E59B1|nr:hypothetical protein [Agrobacterium pusense]MBW9076955.1 hypothetical protein [Agrobacterium pusense]